jgi:hypothetical protein
MIDLPANIVLLGSNMNRISSTGRHRGGHSCLRTAGAWIGALVGKVTSLPTSLAPSLDDFVAKWTEPGSTIEGAVPESPWLVYCDGAWVTVGIEAAVILMSPSGIMLRCAARF